MNKEGQKTQTYWLKCFHASDGIDHEDSYPLQPYRHRHSPPEAHWDDRCSCESPCSQSSEDLAKPHGAKVDLYPPEDTRRDYPPPVVQLLPTSGASVGREAVLDRGCQGTQMWPFIVRHGKIWRVCLFKVAIDFFDGLLLLCCEGLNDKYAVYSLWKHINSGCVLRTCVLSLPRNMTRG